MAYDSLRPDQEAALEASAAYNRRGLAAPGPSEREPCLAVALNDARALLQACADRFREYERHHAAKPDAEKAERNRYMAERCEALVARTLNL